MQALSPPPSPALPLAKPDAASKPTTGKSPANTMKALVFHGANRRAWEDKPKPGILKPTDAIVKISKTTMAATIRAIEGWPLRRGPA